MNGIRLPEEFLHNPKKPNIFKLRDEIYKQVQGGMLQYIDDMFSVCEPEKQKDILARKPESKPYSNSMFMFYKGVEIPIIDRNKMILDGIEYIPTLQIVDKPIHSQKNGKFIVVKTNMRYSLIKMMGQTSLVITKMGMCPVFIYMLYMYNCDTVAMLTDLGYEFTNDESSAEYFIPDYMDFNKDTVIMIKKCENSKWKEYFISPYIKENLEWHYEVIDAIIQESEKFKTEDGEDIIPTDDVKSDDGDNEKDKEASELLPIENYLFASDEASKLERLRKENLTGFEKKLAHKIASMIYCYFINTKKGRKTIKKSHIANTLHKFIIKDMTLKDVSILGMIQDCVQNDMFLPGATNIGDLSQKMVRYLEWYGMKLISVRSYPEKSMIMEVVKTEQKLVYNNTCNPLSELAVMSRANLFGKGGLPRESCQSNVRNLSDSYFGIIDPCDTPSGANVGISLHMVPEVENFDLEIAVSNSDTSNIFKSMNGVHSNES